jgi:hypothetical protein
MLLLYGVGTTATNWFDALLSPLELTAVIWYV